MRSQYGSLFEKHEREGKITEYIVKWHENTNKVKHIFSEMQSFIQNNGNLGVDQSIHFPFNSLIFANDTGIYQYICQQKYPSYFLYPDMFG